MEKPEKHAAGQSRRARAAQTRTRIVEAATAEFGSKGYAGASMAAIADRAGVAVQTVYFVFHTKAELLGVAIDRAVLGGTHPVLPENQEWFIQGAGPNDIAEKLTRFVSGSGAILFRAAALSEVNRVAALTDEEAKRVYDHHEKLRVDVYRSFVGTLVQCADWPKDASAVQAAEVLLTLTGSSLYRTFREDRGWSHERTMEWLVREVPRIVAPWAFPGSEM